MDENGRKKAQSASIPCRKLGQLSSPQDTCPSADPAAPKAPGFAPCPRSRCGSAQSTEGMLGWKWEGREGEQMDKVQIFHCTRWPRLNEDASREFLSARTKFMLPFQASFGEGREGRGRDRGWEKQAGRGWFLVLRENSGLAEERGRERT